MTAHSNLQSETYICGNSTANTTMPIQLLQLSEGPVMTAKDH